MKMYFKMVNFIIQSFMTLHCLLSFFQPGQSWYTPRWFNVGYQYHWWIRLNLCWQKVISNKLLLVYHHIKVWAPDSGLLDTFIGRCYFNSLLKETGFVVFARKCDFVFRFTVSKRLNAGVTKLKLKNPLSSH